MTETASIYKGDTGGPWNVGHRLDDGTLATLTVAYTCTIKVAGAAIERAVTVKNVDSTRFIAALEPTETATLDVGTHVVAIEVVNNSLTPPLRIETHIILTVEEQIVGSDHVPTTETEIERLTREITELKAQRINVASGNAVIDVWREGRRIRKHISTIEELNSLIRLLEAELVSAQVAAGVTTTSRRRAITLGYRN